jgi:hypothetical protein
MLYWNKRDKINIISSSATSTIIYLITTVSSVTCDEMLDIIALRPSISTNEPKIISSISSQVTDDTVVIKYIMVDVAEDDITTVVLNNVKFDMFKWFHPTKVDYIRDRLTFYL